ncbi:MAG: methyl-accepting chemotaxis protein [Negativicutes bacterium]|nr:methyl-accepting chemotaxis protein [Negativicutes bacterium]
MKRKLTLLLALIGAIPLLAASMVSFWLFNQNMREDYGRLNFARAEALQYEVTSLIDKHMNVLKLMAGNPAVRSFDLAAASPVLWEAARVYPAMVPVAIDSDKGQQLMKTDATTLIPVHDRKFYQQAMQGKEEVVSEVVISKASGHPVVVLATPVRGGDNRIAGVLQGAIDLAVLGDFVAKRSQEGDVAYIIDTEGKVLAHPDAKVLAERKDVSKQDFVAKGLGGQGGTAEITDEQGNKKMVNYVFEPRTGWLVCIEKSYAEYKARNTRLLMTSGLIIVITIFLVTCIGYYYANRTVRPILQLVAATDIVSKGDLTTTVSVDGKDEVGVLAVNFNAMVANLRNLVTQVSTLSEQVAASSEELTASSEQSVQAANQVTGSITNVAHGAEKQRELVNDTSAVVEQMSVNIEHIAVNTTQVADNSLRAAGSAQEGSASVNRAVRQMTQIEQTVTNSAQVVAKLGDRSKEIGQIVDTIAGIAGQTNLLALNAAIEAARAGEQGRGFAVVAEEVRQLAEQSQNAARQIAALISEIQGDTDAAVVAMSEGTREVKVGTEVVTSAGQTFGEIASLVTQVSDQVKEISTDVQQLTNGSKQIVTSVKALDGLSNKAVGEAEMVSAAAEEQSASMEEIAAASQALAKRAEDLRRTVSQFNV